MFSKNFFPTPDNVIDMMLKPLASEHRGGWYLPFRRILEPSAGKGNIVDRMISFYHENVTNISCVEQNADLRNVLIGKGYTVIGTDFLSYREPYVFDLIVMNPPFEDGDKHLLHAWEILNAGDIVCLLNAETILNPYSATRKQVLSLIETHGRYEVIGNAFSHSERSTDVSVVIVWLHKDGATDFFNTDNMQKESHEFGSEFAPNALASKDAIAALVARYDAAIRIIKEMHELELKYGFYTAGVFAPVIPGETFDPAKAVSSHRQKTEQELNAKITDLKRRFWNHVFTKTRLGQITTSAFREKLMRTIEETSNLSFSYENVMNVLEDFVINRDAILLQCISDVFDDATRFHKNNVEYREGWKTNKAWKMSKKIIMPEGVDYDTKFGHWGLGYYKRKFYEDIDKAVCYVLGKDPSKIASLVDAVNDRCKHLNSRGGDYSETFSSEFFYIRFFKKGTVHVQFKDIDVLNRLNIVAAQGRQWVGDGE